MAEKKQRGAGRTRNFGCVVYPESAPENWKNILEEHFIPAFISPLHDKDVDPGGSAKKAHYHIMIMYDNVKTQEQAKEVFDSIGGVGCERINSIRSYARYLCHLDNPDKYQYAVEDVISFGGADYRNTIGLASDKYTAICDMMDYCDDNDIDSFWELLRYCRKEREDWFRVLCDNGTFIMDKFLKSREWSARRFYEQEQRNFEQSIMEKEKDLHEEADLANSDDIDFDD